MAERKKIRKFTPEEALAALEELGVPASTGEIADKCRDLAEIPNVERWEITGNDDVAAALKALAADGTLVTVKVPGYGKRVTPEEEPHEHILRSRHDRNLRVYATPKISADWQLHLQHIAAQNEAAEYAAGRLDVLLADLRKDGEKASVKVHDSTEREPGVEIRLDLPRLQALVEALTRLENAS